MDHYQDDDDAFDENGILKDGKRYRIPLRMMDSLQRAVHDHAAARQAVRIIDAPLHQPGFVRDMRAVADRQAIYDEYDASVSAAWKNPPICRNGFVGSQEDEPHRQGSGRDATRDDKQAAYAEYEADIANAWRGAGR